MSTDHVAEQHDLGLGYATGFGLSVLGAAVRLFQPSESGWGILCWLLPAAFLGGVALAAHGSYRRFGTGMMLGSLTVAVAVFMFVSWLVSQIGS